MKIIRTDSSDRDFVHLVDLLDADLSECYGALMAHYVPFNRLDLIRHAIVLYAGDQNSVCMEKELSKPISSDIV